MSRQVKRRALKLHDPSSRAGTARNRLRPGWICGRCGRGPPAWPAIHFLSTPTHPALQKKKKTCTRLIVEGLGQGIVITIQNVEGVKRFQVSSGLTDCSLLEKVPLMYRVTRHVFPQFICPSRTTFSWTRLGIFTPNLRPSAALSWTESWCKRCGKEGHWTALSTLVQWLSLVSGFGKDALTPRAGASPLGAHLSTHLYGNFEKMATEPKSRRDTKQQKISFSEETCLTLLLLCTSCRLSLQSIFCLCEIVIVLRHISFLCLLERLLFQLRWLRDVRSCGYCFRRLVHIKRSDTSRLSTVAVH